MGSADPRMGESSCEVMFSPAFDSLACKNQLSSVVLAMYNICLTLQVVRAAHSSTPAGNISVINYGFLMPPESPSEVLHMCMLKQDRLVQLSVLFAAVC